MDEVPLETGCLSLLEPFDPASAGLLSADLVSAFELLSEDFESAAAPFAEPLRLSVR